MDLKLSTIRIFIAFILYDKNTVLKAQTCDTGEVVHQKEGNIGQSSDYPWLGVLKVHLYQGSDLRVALTGIVLIHKKFAIANADNVARIPKVIFLQDSEAMFYQKSGETWTTKLRDCTTHPEYIQSTLNTIAVVELEVEESATVPIKPICWPQNSYNMIDQLYGVGFQDDNNVLEKYMYKLTYLKPSDCEEYYNRSQLSENKMAPTHIQCGYAKFHTSSCVWDSGMAMVSHVNGKYWTLIGFGVQGPGCASPARFIDIFPYIEWIKEATTVKRFNFGQRRVIDNKLSEWLYMAPSQGTTNMETRRRIRRNDYSVGYYPIKYDTLKNVVFPWNLNVEEGNVRNLRIPRYNGACDKRNVVMYREEMKFFIPNGGIESVKYEVSVFDMISNRYDCIVFDFDGGQHSSIRHWLTYSIDDDAARAFGYADWTPRDLVKKMPYYSARRPDKKFRWHPGPHMEPFHETDIMYETVDKTFSNIRLQFTFQMSAELNITMLGPGAEMNVDQPSIPMSGHLRKSMQFQELFLRDLVGEHPIPLSKFRESKETTENTPKVTKSKDLDEDEINYEDDPWRSGVRPTSDTNDLF